MEALADADEDERLDDGAVEIGSDEEYHGWCTYIRYNLKNAKNRILNIN